MILANNKLYHNGQNGHDIKSYQIVIIDNVRFVTFRSIRQNWDSVYLKYIRKKNYLYSFKNYLYI